MTPAEATARALGTRRPKKARELAGWLMPTALQATAQKGAVTLCLLCTATFSQPQEPSPVRLRSTGMRQMNQLFGELLHVATRAIEVAGVLVIVAGIVRTGFHYIRHRSASDAYRKARCTLGRAILLGLELLMAADIINTVTMEPSWDSVMALGGIVLIRTFLSLALEVEIDGRWPWNRSPGHRAQLSSDNNGSA